MRFKFLRGRDRSKNVTSFKNLINSSPMDSIDFIFNVFSSFSFGQTS